MVPKLKRPSRRNEGREKICIPIVETTVEKAIRAIEEAKTMADLIELRVDYLRKPKIASLLGGRQKPFIVTNRRKEEGGRYDGVERERLSILKEAIDLGAEYIDVEVRSEREMLHHLMVNRKETNIILSFHDFDKTPPPGELQKLFDRMIRWRADTIKIATFARCWEDNLRVLSLLSYAKARKQKMVAFCMGEKGKVSRVLAPFMGAAWAYSCLSRKRTSAPGQLTVKEMKDISEKLR
ncbi:MAG: type I 3-dehydroquinate dehydratase [Deltaproteobacteria bacterium RBG_16_48_10]|nr:MAG: type I 3-dehydroquinate dehydratase [Deltaproteobacteria bacterium RBG_16_48_10]